MSSDCGTGSRSVLEWRVPLRFLCTQEEELRRSPGLFLRSRGPGEGAQITPRKKPDKRHKPDASADLSDRAMEAPGTGKRGPQKRLRQDRKLQGGARTPQTRTEQRTERQSDQSWARIPRRRSTPQNGKYRAHRGTDRRRSRNRGAGSRGRTHRTRRRSSQPRLDRRPRPSRRRGSRRGAAEPALEDHGRRLGATLDGSAPKLSESDQSPDALRRSSCEPEWQPERATTARWRKRTAEAAKRQKRLAERPEEAPRKKHVRSFSFWKMQKSKNMKKFLRSY